jgi:hypothetical protein
MGDRFDIAMSGKSRWGQTPVTWPILKDAAGPAVGVIDNSMRLLA